jgi:hypothetical protein
VTAKQVDEVLSMQGKFSVRETSRKTGVDRRRICKLWKDGKGAVKTAEASLTPAPTTGKVVSVAEVLQSYDIVGQVLEKVQKISGSNVMRDDALRSEFRVGEDKWRRVAGSTRLAGYWALLPDKTRVWGSKSVITKLNDQIREL